MTVDINTIAGFLGGSLVTLVIKEILNQYNKRQDFTRELKKITYIKKLEKAENAIAFYWTYLNRVLEAKKGLEVILHALNEMQKDEYENDIPTIQNLLDLTGKALTDLANEKYSGINAIHLYFDLEDKIKWNEKDLGDFFKSLSETMSINKEIEYWMVFHNKALAANNAEHAEMFWGKAIELLPTLINSFQKWIDVIEKNRLATYAMVQEIKKQLKQY